MKVRITRVSGLEEFCEIKERNFSKYVDVLFWQQNKASNENIFHGGNFDLIKRLELIDCCGVVVDMISWWWSDYKMNPPIPKYERIIELV